MIYKVRQYLTSKFEIGDQSARKDDLRQVSQDMRKAKGENGERLFSQEEWLTKAKIQGFSSVCPPRDGDGQVRLRAPRLTLDEEEVNHMTTVESVVANWLNASDCL